MKRSWLKVSISTLTSGFGIPSKPNSVDRGAEPQLYGQYYLPRYAILQELCQFFHVTDTLQRLAPGELIAGPSL